MRTFFRSIIDFADFISFVISFRFVGVMILYDRKSLKEFFLSIFSAV